MKLIKLIISIVFLAAVLTSPVYAQGSEPPRITGLLEVIRRIITFLAPAAAIAFFVMLLIAGYRFITSGGDPKGVGQARATLTYAVIGVILVAAAWLILQLIESLTGAKVTTVNINP